MGAILNFLGGAAFRAIWGEVSSYFSKKQEHKFEIERIRQQEICDAATHGRNLESLRLQSELGVKEVRVKSEAALDQTYAAAWQQAVAQSQVKIGIPWIDGWNGMMRPAFYTLALFIVLLVCFNAGWNVPALQAAGMIDLVFSIIGFLFADRTIGKRK